MVSIEAREGSPPASRPPTAPARSPSRSTRRAAPTDLVQPGHVFPLRARPGGILERAGRTEAAVDLAAGAGLRAAGVLCQVMRDDGHMARGEDLELFATRHGLAIVDVVRRSVERRRAAEPDAAGEARRDRRRRDARRDGPLRHRRLGRHRPRRRRRAGRHHRQRDLLGLARPAAAARLPGAQLRDARPRSATSGASRSTSSPPSSATTPTASPEKGDAVRAHEVEFDDHDLGVPVLPGSLATIACEVEAIHPAGDHEIVVGLAHHLEHREPGAEPLLFYRGVLLARSRSRRTSLPPDPTTTPSICHPDGRQRT